MVLEHQKGQGVERGTQGRGLLQDVDAVLVALDHARDAAHLALDAREPAQQLGAILAVAVAEAVVAHTGREYTPLPPAEARPDRLDFGPMDGAWIHGLLVGCGCASCGGSYRPDAIRVLAQHGDMAIVALDCDACATESLTLVPLDQGRAGPGRRAASASLRLATCARCGPSGLLRRRLQEPFRGSRPSPTPAPSVTAFAHASEEELARILDYYQVAWEYEPRSFPILFNLEGEVVESFAPDFYLPELDLYVELTTLKQSLVRKKNRKLRRLRELYPDVRIKLFYARDFRALLLKYGRQELTESLTGPEGQSSLRAASEVEAAV